MKKKISRRYVYILVGVAALIALLLWVHPIAFIKTGILTKEKVDQYEKQYDLGAARKFDANDKSIKNVYMFYIGNEAVEVQDKTVDSLIDVNVRKVAPFLYRWNIPEGNWGIFRVTLGNDKYYCLYITN